MIETGMHGMDPTRLRLDTGVAVERKKSSAIIQYLDRGGKTRLDLGPNNQELTFDIDEVITDFYRSKKKSSLRGDLATETFYQANCRSATQDFGRLLSAQTGEEDERKFFERYQQAKYFDIETPHTNKRSWQGFDFHSIGFLEIPNPSRKDETYYIAIDLTYNASTNSDTRTLVVHGNDAQTVKQELQKIYGTKNWDTFQLNPNKGTYLYMD